MHFLLCDPVYFPLEGGQAVFREAQQLTHLATHSLRGKTVKATNTNISKRGDVHHCIVVEVCSSVVSSYCLRNDKKLHILFPIKSAECHMDSTLCLQLTSPFLQNNLLTLMPLSTLQHEYSPLYLY